MQDKLITSIHNKADKRYEALLRTAEEARTRGVEVLEGIGTLVLDDSIPDRNLRKDIFALLPSDDITKLVEGCRNLQSGAGGSGSSLSLVNHWYGYTRKYSPALLEKTPFQFVAESLAGPRSRVLERSECWRQGKIIRRRTFRLSPAPLGQIRRSSGCERRNGPLTATL